MGYSQKTLVGPPYYLTFCATSNWITHAVFEISNISSRKILFLYKVRNLSWNVLTSGQVNQRLILYCTYFTRYVFKKSSKQVIKPKPSLRVKTNPVTDLNNQKYESILCNFHVAFQKKKIFELFPGAKFIQTKERQAGFLRLISSDILRTYQSILSY